jgi:tetratricopeptide (TPR) repeat protein
LDPASYRLDSPTHGWVGREREIDTLVAALARDDTTRRRLAERSIGPAAGIRGTAGSGRTALALQVARRLADNYPDGPLYLNLRGSSAHPLSCSEALARLINALEPLSELCQDEAELAARYRSLLLERRVLVILDDVPKLEQILPLFPPPGCALLLTAQQAFKCRIPFVDVLRIVDLGPLPPQDAWDLLGQLAPHLDAAIEPLAEGCGGLPLALRLAGGALVAHPGLEAESYLERLREATAHWPLIEAVLRVSLALQSSERQTQWQALALLHGFDLSAAAAAWDVERSTAREILIGFLERGLVESSPAIIALQRQDRFDMHETLRAYALARMEEAQHERDHLRTAAHYLEVLRTAATLCAQEVEDVRAGLALLDLEWDNVLDSQAWVAQVMDHSRHAGQLCSAYADVGSRCLERRTPDQTRIRWLYDALRAAREWIKPQAEIEHLGRLAAIYQCQGKVEQAIAYYGQSLGVAVQINDRPAQSELLGSLGSLYSLQGENERAFGYFQQALSVAQALGDRRGEGNWMGNLGSAYRALGEVEQALRYHHQALAISRERGDRRSEAIWLGNLGNSHMAMGDPRQAIRAYKEAIEIAREVGDRREQASLLGNLGNACSAQDRVREALDAYESALQIVRELGDRESEGIWLLNKSLLLDRKGQRETAVSCAQEALEALRQAGSPDAETAETLLERWK